MESYISLLSSDNYLPGVLALARSLKSTNPAYPLHIAVSTNVSQHARDSLAQNALPTILLKKQLVVAPEIAQANRAAGVGHWTQTFDKIWLFGLTEFKKLVYLDSDMLILHNIDELFAAPHMSAVIAGQLAHPEWNNLNSGLVVIEPSEGLGEEIMRSTLEPTLNRLRETGRLMIGDQDLLQSYYRDWPERFELHLDHIYNAIVTDMSTNLAAGYRLAKNAAKDKTIKVLHFAGFVPKPWRAVSLVREALRFALRREQESTILRLHWMYRRVLTRAHS